MSIFEYDQEKHMRQEREDAWVDGAEEARLSMIKKMLKNGMSKEDVHEIAQGRVWTGEDAMKIGLVDVFGGLEDAVRLAAEKAGLENYRIAELPAQKNPFELILNNLSASVKENVLRTELGGWYEWYQNHKALLTTQGVMARIPYDIVFN